MEAPIIYFAFANDTTKHLNCLKEESSNIKKALAETTKKGWIKLEREESIEPSDLENILTDYEEDSLVLFHYAGHANSENIFSDSGGAIKLAPILATQKDLKLVFLNGCSTQQQVQALFEVGVKAVIATAVPIGDTRAKDFATTFYKALAVRKTIKNAFIAAQQFLESKEKKVPTFDIAISRSAVLRVKETDSFPWTLYVQEEFEDEVLQYMLPTYKVSGLPDSIRRHIRETVTTNTYLIQVLDEMCKYNTEIYNQKEALPDSSQYINLIIKNFPWVIGSQINFLRQEEYYSANNNRLEQLISSYIVSSQLVYYILLSDLWEKKKGSSSINIPTDFLVRHQITSEKDILQYNFVDNAFSIFQLFKQFNLDVFISELSQFFVEYANTKSNLYKATQYLQSIREQFFIKGEKDLAKECNKVEQALAVFLKRLAFFASYTMLAVRNINIENPRGVAKIQYELDMGILNADSEHTLTIYNDAGNRRKEVYSDCRSIILLSRENKVNDFLNLSPFIIDKNAYFTGGKPNVIDPYMYMYQATIKKSKKKTTSKAFHFFALKHSIKTALENQKGTDMIHTKMTDIDFKEGENITDNEEADFFGGEFDEISSEEEGISVFKALEDQFEHMSSIFTSLDNSNVTVQNRE